MTIQVASVLDKIKKACHYGSQTMESNTEKSVSFVTCL